MPASASPCRPGGWDVGRDDRGTDLGGTCPNRGCTPKKVLVAAGHALHEIERAHVHHISVGKPKLDWAALIDREKDMIKDIPESRPPMRLKSAMSRSSGAAPFRGAQRHPRRRSDLRQAYRDRDRIKPRPLPIPGAELMITSDEMLSDREQPGP